MKRKIVRKVRNGMALLLVLCCVFAAVGECTIPSAFAAEVKGGVPEMTESDVSGVPDTTESEISGMPDTTESEISGMPDTTESDVSGMPDTTESEISGVTENTEPGSVPEDTEAADGNPEGTEAAAPGEGEKTDDGAGTDGGDKADTWARTGNPAGRKLSALDLAGISKSDGITVTKVELRKDNAEIKNGDGLSFTDSVEVRYYFADLYLTEYTDDSGVSHQQNCTNGTTYVIGQMPNTLVWPDSDVSWDMQDGSGTKWAELVYMSTGELHLALAVPGTIDNISGAYATFSARLNKDELGDAAQTASIVFAEGGGKTYEVALVDNIPTPPSITKTGSYDSTANKIAWEVTLTEGSGKYGDGLRIEDTFDDKQELVAGSIRVTAPAGGTNETPEVNGNTISSKLTPSGTKGSVWKLTYETVLRANAIVDRPGELKNGTIQVNVTNHAYVYDQKTDDPIADVEKTVSCRKEYKWMNKTGVVNSATGEITWTITVDTNGFPFQSITVYDKVEGTPVNSPASAIKFADVNVPSGATPAYADSADMVATQTKTELADGKSQTYSMKIDLGAAAAGTNVYEITYKTKVDGYEAYIKYNQPQVKNSAWMTFDWDYNGDGPVRFGIPTMAVTKKIATGSILKSDGSYDRKTHMITWAVTVNADKAALEQVTVKDILGGGQNAVCAQSYEKIQNLKIDDTSVNLSDITITKNADDTVTFDFGDRLNGKSAAFEVVTKLTDPKVYENNVTTANIFYNKAELYTKGNLLSSDSGKAEQKNTVLDKKAPAYQYDTNTLSWTIEVNQDQMELGGVAVSDVIPKWLSLNPDTIKLDGSKVSAGSSGSAMPYYEYNNGTGELSVSIGDITETKKLTFDTLIDVDNAVFDDGGVRKAMKSYNGDITISNTAVMSKTSSDNRVSDEGSIRINNKILNKTGNADKSTGRVSYQVVINQPMTELAEPCVISDELSEGLTLNLPQLKLYRASVAANGAVAKAGQVEKAQFSYETAVLSNGATLLELTLPAGSGRQCYILEYSADVTDATKANYSNKISMTGLDNGSTGTKVDMSNAQIIGGGGGSMSGSSRVEITNKDKESGDVLAGAVFALSYDGHEIGRKTTGENGIVMFTNLEVGAVYTVTEIAPPAGYAQPDAVSQEFTAPAKGNANRARLTFENEKLKTQITFKKVDENGNPLAGAGFALYEVVTADSSGTLAKVGECDSLADGTVTFKGVTEGEYRIKELAAPENYLLSSDEIVAVVDINAEIAEFYIEGDTSKTTITTFENVPKPVGTIAFTKTDETGRGLPGAVFAMYKAGSGSAETFLANETSGADGRVEFSGFRKGTYHIREITAPEGYKRNAALELTVEVEEDAVVSAFYDSSDAAKTTVKKVVNEKLPTAILKFPVKAGDGKPLPGARFAMYRKNETQTEQKVAESVSDASGNITFGEILAGEYIIRQISTADGYEISTVPLILIVNAAGAITAFYAEDTAPEIMTDGVVNEEKQGTDSTESTENPGDTENTENSGNTEDGGDSESTEDFEDMRDSESTETVKTPWDGGGIGSPKGQQYQTLSAKDTGKQPAAQILPRTGREMYLVFYVGGGIFILAGILMLCGEKKRRKRKLKK